MASSAMTHKVASKLLKRRPTLCERSISARGFASATPKAQDDSNVVVGRKEDERSPAGQSQERAVSRNRAWPGSFFPSLLSPFGGYPSTFMRPTSLTQMMDTVDRLFSSMEVPSMGSLRDRIPWDVMEDDKCFKMRMDMPGMTKEDVKLSVEDGDLVVKAEHNIEEGEDDWSSRSYGSYYARIKLPENVDMNDIKAEMKDGVLKVTAPKAEGAKQRHEVQIE